SFQGLHAEWDRVFHGETVVRAADRGLPPALADDGRATVQNEWLVSFFDRGGVQHVLHVKAQSMYEAGALALVRFRAASGLRLPPDGHLSIAPAGPDGTSEATKRDVAVSEVRQWLFLLTREGAATDQ